MRSHPAGLPGKKNASRKNYRSGKGFKRIAKMIAAHHGRIYWGAIVDLNEKDFESYVYFIHHIDDLSAKYGKTSVTML